jgi:hypothetical protein
MGWCCCRSRAVGFPRLREILEWCAHPPFARAHSSAASQILARVLWALPCSVHFGRCLRLPCTRIGAGAPRRDHFTHAKPWPFIALRCAAPMPLTRVRSSTDENGRSATICRERSGPT